MALITCPECNKEISDKAECCPNCGYRLKKKREKSVAIVVGVIILVVIIVGGIIIALNGVKGSSDSGSGNSVNTSSDRSNGKSNNKNEGFPEDEKLL